MALEIRGLTVLLQVYDMPASVRFYHDVLGFEVVSTSPVFGADLFHWALLRLGAAELMLNTAYESDAERPLVPDPARVAGHGDVGLYLECPDVDRAYRELRERGVEMRAPETASYGMRQLYFRDPDGYVVCLQGRAEE